MRVKEVANLVGISVRTLHHYDEIGLLTPDEVTESGYRIYSDKNLEALQQILFYKELGFPLKKIQNIMNAPYYNRHEALLLQRKMLVEKRNRLNVMIQTIDKTLQHMKGERNMTNEEKFAGLDFSINPYEQEAREKWGDLRVDEANAKIYHLTKEQQASISKEWDELFKKLASVRHMNPASTEAQEVIKEWFEYLNHHFGTYSLEAFKGLGQMYVDDERFMKNIDKYGQGLAKFMRDAMAEFVDFHKE